MLTRAPEPARARFTLLLAADLPAAAPALTEAAAAELASDDSRGAAALGWVDEAAGWQPGAAAALLSERAARTDRRRIRLLAEARSRVDRHGREVQACDRRFARLTALSTARSEAVTMLASMPTPHRVRSPTVTSR
jgi:hypothetical protein